VGAGRRGFDDVLGAGSSDKNDVRHECHRLHHAHRVRHGHVAEGRRVAAYAEVLHRYGRRSRARAAIEVPEVRPSADHRPIRGQASSARVLPEDRSSFKAHAHAARARRRRSRPAGPDRLRARSRGDKKEVESWGEGHSLDGQRRVHAQRPSYPDTCKAAARFRTFPSLPFFSTYGEAHLHGRLTASISSRRTAAGLAARRWHVQRAAREPAWAAPRLSAFGSRLSARCTTACEKAGVVRPYSEAAWWCSSTAPALLATAATALIREQPHRRRRAGREQVAAAKRLGAVVTGKTAVGERQRDAAPQALEQAGRVARARLCPRAPGGAQE
jgi:hypothetical protein